MRENDWSFVINYYIIVIIKQKHNSRSWIVAPVLLKQQARIDRMQIELQTGNAKLVIMRQEVENLEKKMREVSND